jgi:putative photosynthetic complex assembly protein 2
MTTYGPAVIFTIIIWWGSTGAILYLNGLPRWTFKWSFAALSAMTLVALFGLAATRGDTSPGSAYCAFACGLTAWAWPTAAFYRLPNGPPHHHL